MVADREYTLPNFNLGVCIWRATTPLEDPPDIETFGQLRYGWAGANTGVFEVLNRMGSARRAGTGPVVILLLPAGTDIRAAYWDGSDTARPDTIECPAGTGRYWYVADWGDQHGGFSNEYRVALVWRINQPPWPVPTPAIYQEPTP